MRTGFAILVLLIVSLFALLPIHAADPNDPPNACPYPDGPHYRPNVAATVQDSNLLLVDSDTNAALMVLDNKVLSYRDYQILWAPNCRYLIAWNVWMPDEPGARRFTSIYDTLTG